MEESSRKYYKETSRDGRAQGGKERVSTKVNSETIGDAHSVAAQ